MWYFIWVVFWCYLTFRIYLNKDKEECHFAAFYLVVAFLAGTYISYRGIITASEWDLPVPSYVVLPALLIFIGCGLYVRGVERKLEIADSGLYWVMLVAVHFIAFIAPFAIYYAVKVNADMMLTIANVMDNFCMALYLRFSIIPNDLKPPSKKDRKEKKAKWNIGKIWQPAPGAAS